MFDFDTVIELMKKYGYSSTSVHPYIYQSGDNLGICYTYIDDEYGLLERIKIFDNLESFEEFLKQLEFVRNHGKENNIRMVLDNYETMNPKVVFLRNEMIMLEGEMFNIEDFDRTLKQRDHLDDVTKVIYKAGDLLLVYDEIKGRQLQYLRNIVTLKNTLRRKYFELQKEIDTYNKYKVERSLNLLPDINDIGINDRMEIAIKDRYNMYIVQPPTYEEAVDFLREVWDLNKNLELNRKYYEAQKDENDTRNEIKVVDAKIELMKSLNDDYKPLFGIDLVSRFRKINKKYNLVNNKMSDDMVNRCIENIERKYSVYDNLDILSTSDYLREAMQNTNYGDLAIKYSNAANRDMVVTNKLPLNEVAASLSIQYRDKLTVQEQAIMVLYNNHKYRKLCNAILEVEDFDTLPVKKVISKISNIKGFSKIKSECYDIVKKRIDDPINSAIKSSLFAEYDFSSFESFVSCLIRELLKLRHVDRKMMINGNINMYLQIKDVEDVTNKKFVMVTNDLNGLLNETKGNNNMIGIVLLKESTPVLYSPYYFDVGDIYTKGASLQMYIREMINFELLIEINDIAINIDPVKTNVVRYYTNPEVFDNISVVEDIMMNYKTTFCKYSFRNNLPVIQQEIPAIQTGVIAEANPEMSVPSESNIGQGEASPVVQMNVSNEGQNNDIVNANMTDVNQQVQVPSEVAPIHLDNSNLDSEQTLNVTNNEELVKTEVESKDNNVSITAEVKLEATTDEAEKEKSSTLPSVNSQATISGENNVDKVIKQVQPVQSAKIEDIKAEESPKEKAVPVSNKVAEINKPVNKVGIVAHNNLDSKSVNSKDENSNSVETKKVVKQVVAKPVVSGSTQQVVKKVVVPQSDVKKAVSTTSNPSGGQVNGATTPKQVNQTISSPVKAGVTTTTKPPVAGVVKSSTPSSNVSVNKTSIPLKSSTGSVVPKSTTNTQTVAKPVSAGVINSHPTSSTAITSKGVIPKAANVSSENATQKKVVVSSVTGQKPTKSAVVVNTIGAPTHTGQTVPNKAVASTQSVNVTNAGMSKNNIDIEKNKTESVK